MQKITKIGQWHGPEVVVFDMTGTITLTNGANTIAGTLTIFDTELQVGDILYDVTDKFSVVVGVVTNDTTATATGLYGGTGGAAHACKRIRLKNPSTGVVNVPARYNVVLAASAADAVKIPLDDFPTNDTIVIRCEETAVLVWVKATSAANEVVTANSLLRGLFGTEYKHILLQADIEYTFSIGHMLSKGYNLYCRRLNGAASTMYWYAFAE